MPEKKTPLTTANKQVLINKGRHDIAKVFSASERILNRIKPILSETEHVDIFNSFDAEMDKLKIEIKKLKKMTKP